MMGRVDAHHHLWCYTPDEYGWIGDEMAPIRRDFLLDELTNLLRSAGVDRTVAVQARQSVEETRWLLSLVDREPIAGVVGWLPLEHPHFPALLQEFNDDPALKGLRHVVQAEPPGFLDGGAFNAGVARMKDAGLVYDLLVLPHQLREAIRFVDRHPQQAFVVDHMAKPPVRTGGMEPWAGDMRELARREHVTCKISGMVTEADPARWTAGQLEKYFDIVLEAFTPTRLMFGSDWPVLTLGCGYVEWWQTVERWIAPLSEPESAAILGDTAAKIYRLNTASDERMILT